MSDLLWGNPTVVSTTIVVASHHHIAFLCDHHLHEALTTIAITNVHSHCTCAFSFFKTFGQLRTKQSGSRTEPGQTVGIGQKTSSNILTVETPKQREEWLIGLAVEIGKGLRKP